jgi:hypothetical protein
MSIRFDNNKNRIVIVISSIASASFLIYSITRNLIAFEFHGLGDTIALFVNITYPMLDLILIIPAVRLNSCRIELERLNRRKKDIFARPNLTQSIYFRSLYCRKY